MRKKEIIFATRNKGKFREVERILRGCGYKIVPLFSLRESPFIEEDGRNFSENAVKKALLTAKFYKKMAIGEDSGLAVNFLGGAPGIKSARFSKEGTDKKNIEKLLRKMRNVSWKERRARFVCKVALASPEKVIKIFSGECRGYITFTPQGNGGFGYDPVFFVYRYRKTFAELPIEIKNTLSHRYRAFIQLKDFLAGRSMV